MADLGPLQPTGMELDLAGCRQAWPEETWAGAQPRSLDDNHGHSLLISTELLQIVERAVFRGVSPTSVLPP